MTQPDAPRILFIRPDHLGDVLLTLPAVAALRRALPSARLTYAVPVAAGDVPRHCPQLDETLTLPFPRPGSRGAAAIGWAETARTEAAKLAQRFDAALVVRPDDPWSGELVAAARIPIRIGFDMPRTRPYLTDVLPVPHNQHVSADGFDLADALLAHLGVRARTSRVVEACFVTTPAEESEAAAVLAGVGSDPRPIVLHPGSGWPLKNWPARRWRRLAAELARTFATTPVVAGSAEERALVADVASGTGAIELAGCLSLGALAAVHRRARLVVATDSGALHLAAAMGAPVVGLFGPADPALFAPLSAPERTRVVRVGLPCSPCGTLEQPPCGATVAPACVASIGVEAVLRAAMAVVRPAARRTRAAAAR